MSAADCERHGVRELSPVEGDWGGQASPKGGAAQPPEGEEPSQGPAAGVRPVQTPGCSLPNTLSSVLPCTLNLMP